MLDGILCLVFTDRSTFHFGHGDGARRRLANCWVHRMIGPDVPGFSSSEE
jgi:hypothetical protein